MPRVKQAQYAKKCTKEAFGLNSELECEAQQDDNNKGKADY